MTATAAFPTLASTDLARLVGRALTRSVDRVRDALDHAVDGDRRRLHALDRWFAGVAAEVRAHFEHTEVHVLPVLAERAVIDERTLETFAGDHAWADHLVGELGDALGVLAHGLGESDVWITRAIEITDELALVLGGIVAREWRLLLPQVEQTMTTLELERLHRARRRDVTTHRAPFTVAWLRDCSGRSDGVDALERSIPGPLRLVHRSRRRAYRKAARAAFRTNAA
jgi:hypothetical protein